MADRHNDDFERRLADRLRAHADRAVDKVDAPGLARHLAEAPNQSHVARRWTAAVVTLTVVLASLVTVSALQLLPGGSPKPVPTGTPGPSASGSLAAPAIDETGTFAGGGLWARHGGDLYLSTDGGASWSQGTIGPNPIAVSVLDTQHAWTVSVGPGSTGNTGDPSHDVLHYVVGRTTDGGASWAQADLPGSYPETGPALSFVDPQRGYLLIAPERFSNGDATLLATRDGGGSWRQVGTAQSPLLQYGRMFTASANGTLWAGAEGTASGAGNWDLLQVSRDGGTSWQPVSLPGRDVLSSGDYLLAPPTVLGSSVILAVDVNGPITFYRSSDAGQTWQASKPLPFDGSSYGIPAILDATHWLVPAPTGLTIWVTGDAGASWREQPTAGLPGLGPIVSLSFADAEHGIAAVSLGNTPAPDGLFVTQDGGRTWRPAALPSLPEATPSPSAVASGSLDPGALAVWSGGETGLVGGTEGAGGRVDRTTDGGKTWATIWRPDAPVVYLVAFGSTDAVAETCASAETDCTLWRSADGGATWTEVGTTPAAVSFSDPQHGWRLVPIAPPPGTPTGGPGAAAIERTSDGGQTWRAASPVPCGPGTPIALGPTAIAAQSATSAWLLCTGGPATIMENKALAVTSDGGATWQVRAATIGSDPSGDVGQIPSTGHPSGLAIAPDGTAWMVGGRMLPLVSRDGGRTWIDMPLGEIDVKSVSAPMPLDDQHGFALMFDPNSQANLLEVTVDGGTIWAVRFSWPFP